MKGATMTIPLPRLRHIGLFVIVLTAAGGCIDYMLRFPPKDYLSVMSREQRLSRVDPEVRRKGMSAFGAPEDHARWKTEIAHCRLVASCVMEDLDETRLFDRDDWRIVDRFFTHRDTDITVETMYGRLWKDDEESRTRVEAIERAFLACGATPTE